MPDRPIRIPGPDHPITIEPATFHVVVTHEGFVLADTRNALILREANYPPVLYIPRGDVAIDRLERSSHTTYCPFKGDCAYYSLPGGSARAANAVWTYEAPYEAVAAIPGHLAFYPDRGEIIQRAD